MRESVMAKGSMIGALVLFLMLTFTTASLADYTADDFLKDARKTVTEINVGDAKVAIESGQAVLLDCRTAKEFKRGHVPAAVHLERGLLEWKVCKKFPDKSQYIIVYCKSGGRSCLSARTLEQMGYSHVASMNGGWKGWVAAGYPVE